MEKGKVKGKTTKEVNITKLIEDDHFISVISSKRNIGKSFLCKWLIYRLLKKNPKRWDYIYAFSNTSQYNGDWSILPERFVVNGYKEELLQMIIDLQSKKVKEMGQENAPNCCIILDDVISGQSDAIYKSRALSFIFTQGRHINISLFLLIQYSKGFLTPTYRSNIDYLFVGKSSRPSMEGFYDMVSTNRLFPSFSDFQRAMNKLTENTRTYLDGKGRKRQESKFFFMNNTSYAHPSMEICIVKASPVPSSFKIGFKGKQPISSKGDEKPTKKKPKSKRKKKEKEEDSE